jgi:hypothetical protein
MVNVYVLHTHASQHPIVAPRCLRNSHHPWPCLALTPSIVTMCNAGCIVTFTKIGYTIVYHGLTIVCNHKGTRTGLWMIPLTPWSPTAPTALSAINPPSIAMAANVNATSSATKYAQYVHQLLCSPLVATGNTSPCPCNKHQAKNYSGTHSSIDLVPFPMFHGHQQRPYVLPLLAHCINLQQSR